MADTPAERPRHRGQFKPGQSGNPSGRPKINPEVKAAFESYLPEAIAVLGKALKGTDEKLRIAAAVHITDRVLGKPQQNVSAKIEGVDPAQAHLEALQALSARRPKVIDEDDSSEVTSH